MPVPMSVVRFLIQYKNIQQGSFVLDKGAPKKERDKYIFKEMINMNNYYENYQRVAEFYPLIIRDFAESEEILKRELMAMPTTSYPILDIGSGSGRTVIAIAESIPDVEIFAVEPSPVMRAILTQQVVQSDDLRKRVTIIPEPVENLLLPDKLGAVVAYGVLGHLDLSARKQLWDKLIPRLPKGSSIFVELFAKDKPMDMAPMQFQETIGQRRYVLTFSGEHVGEDLMRLTSKWTISGGIASTVEVESSNFWHTFGLDDLACETGLTAKKLTHDSGVLYV